MSAELKDRHVRPRRSIFLIAGTSFALTLSALGVAPAGAADPIPADGSWQAEAVAASATTAELRAEVADGELRMIVVREEKGEPDVTVVSVSDTTQLNQALNSIKKDSTVISIEVDRKLNLLATASLPNVATVAPAYIQWNYSALRLSEIHPSLTGNGTTIAVIDTGVNRNGTDLNGTINDTIGGPIKVLDGCDWVTSLTNECTGTGVLDQNGHGTHVAGIIAAKNDGEGITGVAPQAQILPLRVLDSNGSGYLSDVAAAIDYAVLHGAQVINMSLGGTYDYYLIEEAVDRASVAGVILVAAAGNSGPTNTLPSFPAAYDNVIAVAATDQSGVVAGYSNQGSYLDISAPGSAIVSTYGLGYASLSGTSMASPHVAGVVALMRDKDIATSQIKYLLQTNANSSAPRNVQNRYGAGLINAYDALSCNTTSCAEPSPAPTPTETIASTTVINPGEVITAPSTPSAPVQVPAPAAPAPAPVAAPVAAPPVAVEVIGISNVVKRKFTLTVDSPAGSKTWIQRKSGKKWVTLKKVNSSSRSVVKVSKSGTYRIQIVGPSRKDISSPFKVK